MKIEIEIECTPEEARTFLGLPDVSKANSVYTDAITKAMQGAAGFEQLQDMAKTIAPMGEIGMKIFQGFMEAGKGKGAASGPKKGGD